MKKEELLQELNIIVKFFVFNKKTALSLLLLMLLSSFCAKAQISIDDISINEIKRQAGNGNVGLQFVLGNYYQNGKRVEKDLVQAKYWYGKAVNGGHEDAKAYLAMIYDDEKDYDKAYPLFLSYANNPQNERKNTVNSLYNMSLMRVGFYKIEGKGTSKDINGAVEWLEKARSNGYIYSLLGLLECYRVLDNSSKRFIIAQEIKEKMGNPFHLAECYLFGIGCKQNLSIVYNLLSEIANGKVEFKSPQGTLRLTPAHRYAAQLYIGVANYFDKNKTNHYEEAIRWLNSVIDSSEAIATDRGKAMCLLQRCYRFGRGVKADVAKANDLERESKKLISEDEYNEFLKHFEASY